MYSKSCGYLTLLVALALLTACPARKEEALYPQASPDADTRIILNSNQDQTSFYVDGQFIAKGKSVKVLVNNQPHTITAQPDGYIGKDENIRPPYRDGYSLDFVFLIEDQLDRQPK